MVLQQEISSLSFCYLLYYEKRSSNDTTVVLDDTELDFRRTHPVTISSSVVTCLWTSRFCFEKEANIFRCC